MPNSVRVLPQKTAGREKILASEQTIECARDALIETTREENIGEYRGLIVEGERLVSHTFECLLAGYNGWVWTVTLTRLPRSSKITIDEISLLPSEHALLAPKWIPWAERLRPGDVSPTDRLPYREDDPRLDEGFEATDEDADQLADFELGLGRKRVLSREGREDAYKRWYGSDHGPKTAGTRAARAKCSACGFFIPMAGSARHLFGVCANEWSGDDGKVVSLDHGCGAHSETDAPKERKMWDPADPVVNELDLEIAESEAE